ncbi:MAG TPA: archaeosortase/exosortase family protein [Pyrinomonadaceae bacterium]|nr:archaeosortase/exosortase family protein [Pyrinomonadaceae bacterium]
MSGKRKIALVLAAQFLALWPVWQWYAARVMGSADGKWGLLAALFAAVLLWRKRVLVVDDAANARLWLPALFLLLYAASYTFIPPLARAAIGFTAVGLTLSALVLGRRCHAGLLGLLYLSLPVIPSLQFYGGYPLRVFVATVTAPILRLGGFNVVQEGTCLNWGGQLIWIDAPCSGVRMLWVGLFLVCVLAAVYDLRPLRTLYSLAAAFVVIIFGNVFRAVALFYLEAKVVEMPSWSHEYVGVVAFVVIAAGIVLIVRRMREGEKLCAQPLSI